jgi:ABC-2 type transport system ATP-binding protein
VLELIDVSKSYHGILAVKPMTVSVRPGEVVGLLGPNGSGKTTTARVIVGLLPPTTGRVRWNGVDVGEQLMTYRADIGYVPEEPHLYSYLTATEYLQLIGGLRGIARPVLERRIARYLELFRLDADPYALLSTFSKGMRQKVLLASALIHDPALVVLDEPASGLDVESSLVLRALVSSLVARGKMVIYSSHAMDEVERVCERVIILYKGQVVADDAVARLRQGQQAASLEEVFAALAVRQNVEQTGADLAGVGVLEA